MLNFFKSFLIIIFFTSLAIFPQSKAIHPMVLDVGNIHLKMDPQMGDAQMGFGGLQSQFSWNLADNNSSNTELFYWPRDEWQSNMLYQIFNPVSLGDSGIIDANGTKNLMYASGSALINYGRTEWAEETRRYRSPVATVDGIELNSPQNYKINPDLVSDIKIEFEDVLPQFGIKSHVEIYSFSNKYFSNFFIWKATHKFTGETTTPDDTANYSVKLPDQTIKFWWPIAFSFGPTKGGEKVANGAFGYEGTDDLDNWFKRKSELTSNSIRDTLYVAYYQDYLNSSMPYIYPNGSTDDTGDPDRINGHLYSTQIPGYALLYADKSNMEKIDDPHQPYSLPHAGIMNDTWSRRDVGLKLTYRGDDSKGRFPVQTLTEKGPMRFITVGPYEMTKDSKTGRYDSITIVYAVGVGSIGWNAADSIGKHWFKGEISDSVKNFWVSKGRDSLWKALDIANWVWNRIARNQNVPSPPPAPDVDIISGKSIIVNWSYPDSSYFKDAVTGIDDWQAWRVYRKRGSMLVGDPADPLSGEKWEMIFETTDRNILSFQDETTQPLVEYHYAVTALDDGTQNSSDILPGVRLESSRFVNMTTMPAFLTSVNDNFKSVVSYSLQQNYPNPFNPSTIIRFTIPSKEYVTLKVFDLLGKEVAQLVNEEKSAGSYNVSFDGENLSAGIYFYRLNAGKYIESKKLILIK